MATSTLLPWRGYPPSPIAFSRGPAFVLFDWFSTPTELPSYRGVFFDNPGHKLRLYADPEEAGRLACLYHDFEAVIPARILWSWPAPEHLLIDLDAADGTTLTLDLQLRSSLGTKIVEAVLLLRSDSFRRSARGRALLRNPVYQAATDAVMRLLIPGARTVPEIGRTETGRTYLLDVERLLLIDGATARLNGEDLGSPVSRPVNLGLGHRTLVGRPLLSYGTFNLEYTPGEHAPVPTASSAMTPSADGPRLAATT